MSYNYSEQRHKIFTEDGQVMYVAIRDKTKALLAQSGAVMSGNLFAGSGDSWTMMACWDRMIELGELIEIPNPTSHAGQHRIFIRPYT